MSTISIMEIPPEFEIILKCFPFTGVLFPISNTENQKTKVLNKLVSTLKYLVEVIFLLYTGYAIYLAIFFGIYASKTLRATSVAIHAILLLLRVSMLSRKSFILKTLLKLRIFEAPNPENRKHIQSSLWKYALFACALCIFIPISIAVCSTSMILSNIEKYNKLLKFIYMNCTESSLNVPTILVFSVNQMMYMIHFFMFPGLVMTLLSFVYLSYVKTFLRHLMAVRLALLHHFSREEIAKALMLFTVARKIRSHLEKSVSFITFVAYVLTFGNILHLVCAVASNYMSEEESLRDAYSISIFSWTVVCFVVLTMCGSEVARIEGFTKNMAQEVISKNFRMKPEGNKKLIYLTLLNSCSGYKMRFTGWGLFEVDKKLFLTISGVLVTYGVLFASELRKT
ncbi:uncharacterized protein TNIN_307651 [Trichonephila inaurata madagascariensis]|uniref:Gustatory receptor n=1 Tax=Trichonephila inaurata madagascariensis TaxID=2747483 RepID=A0A8X6ISE3_9ARAC|nr:uncharacterized protein TNIN_307651 [Trichonephila inaurata madagascariensis]